MSEDKEVKSPEMEAAEIRKSDAEARKADAETKKVEAEILNIMAEVEQRKIEGEKAKIEMKVAEAECDTELSRATIVAAEARNQRIELDRAEEIRARELEHDIYHHIYRFSSTVEDSSVNTCIKELSYWSRTCPGCDIEIIFYSPGGGVLAGMVLFDFIEELKKKGHKVTTTAAGLAASMAAILLQAGSHRVMGKESYLLIHEVSALALGKMGEIEDTVVWLHKLQSRILDIFTRRCHDAQPEKALTREELENKWKRKDWWLDSEEALALGFVDEVA